MELDDLKSTWEDVSNQAEKQHILTPEIIDQMTKKRVYSNLKRITYPEIAGIIICVSAMLYTGSNFYKLNTIILQGAGIISILLLSALSMISILSLRKLDVISDVNKPYIETLKIFATRKIQFLKFQKINIIISYLLLVTVIILLSKFFGGKDITGSKYFWTFSFSIGYIFLQFYSRWVLRHYNKTLRQAEELLREIQP